MLSNILIFRQALAYDCESFTVSSCDHSTKKHGDLIGIPEETCQDYCKNLDDVTFFRFETLKNGTKVCQCFTSDYRQECAFVGGNQVS